MRWHNARLRHTEPAHDSSPGRRSQHAMSLLLQIENAELAYGSHPLLDGAGLRLVRGERLGLIGRNGSGKSSLLRVIAGQAVLDGGDVRLGDGVHVVLVEQEPVLPEAGTIRESLVLRAALEDMHDERARWRVEARLDEFLHRLSVCAEADPSSASGGERKRAALALAMALEPELLLLDEPTNHLDIGAIALLEEMVQKLPGLILITHDRAFLDRVATLIVELDRGWLRSYPGNFAAYRARKDEELEAEKIAARKFDAFWAQEEVWIRQGIKARRTRNEGRVRRLERLREERAARRERLGNVRLSLDAGERSGKLVAELEHVQQSFGGRVLVRDLSMRLMRGDRLGLV
ncbi:MAG: ATP-binding cassette domain-containing protein, partial [Gammaproteobacteria bacterium]